MSRAQSQNINNGSIAVDAIIQLYQAAFEESEPDRVQKLYGKVLAFSVSHDHDSVRIWGHYAVMQDGLKFYYHEIEVFSLTVRDGRDRNIGYNFTRNIYDTFVPEHLKRIQDAVKQLRDPNQPLGPDGVPGTSGLSFSAAGMLVNDENSQQDTMDLLSQGAGFAIPTESASMAKLREQVEQQREQIDLLLQQLKKSQEREEQVMQQLEQQKKESKERGEKMEQQQKEIIELLKQPHI
ncbi:MAG: hypothetical protein Q9225_008102 [Loekoesia sp. 1 TL-2023]